MSRLVISFVKEWLNEKRSNGIRVIRQLEKWIASLDNVTFKGGSARELIVELPTEEREKFLKDLAERMTVDFGETDPWAHTIFSGDIDGLDVPTGETEESGSGETEEIEDDPVPPSEDESGKDETPEDDGPQKSHTGKREGLPKKLEQIFSKVPIRHCPVLEAYARETVEVIPMLQKMGTASALWHQHLLLAVDPGYGCSEFFNDLVQIYRAYGLVKGGAAKRYVQEYALLPRGKMQDNDNDYCVTWANLLKKVQETAHENKYEGVSTVLICIDISEWQSLLATSECKDYLRQLNSLCGTFLIVFRIPFVVGNMLNATADALNDILNVRTLAVPPVSLNDMVDYTCEELKKNGLSLDDNARNSLEQTLLLEKRDDSFFGYKTADKIVRKMIYNKALANCRSKEDNRVITTSEFEPIPGTGADDDPIAELKKMIGMSEVERRLNEVIIQVKTQRKLAAQGKNVARPAIHMIFTGNPGTGKTTVARILARMMQQEGILRKGHLVEVKGRDLCGQYVGETAPKTSAICRDAYGSVLFIDEAYTLFNRDLGSRDFGREALDTLVAEMENHREDLCVVMAGYKDEMEVMLKANAGLKDRIPFEIEFPNYTKDELEQIFFVMLDGVFEYENDLQEAVHKFFAEIPQETFTSKGFSNARLVRNLFERTWCKAACRQNMEGGELRILKSDLIGAAADSEFKKLLAQKAVKRTAIGFNALQK